MICFTGKHEQRERNGVHNYENRVISGMKLNSTQPASMDAGVKTPQCPHPSNHYCISIL